jgi:hypothetical protein
MNTPEVLNERLPGADHVCRAESFHTAHGADLAVPSPMEPR